MTAAHKKRLRANLAKARRVLRMKRRMAKRGITPQRYETASFRPITDRRKAQRGGLDSIRAAVRQHINRIVAEEVAAALRGIGG